MTFRRAVGHLGRDDATLSVASGDGERLGADVDANNVQSLELFLAHAGLPVLASTRFPDPELSPSILVMQAASLGHSTELATRAGGQSILQAQWPLETLGLPGASRRVGFYAAGALRTYKET